jgi:hypothetical protein
MVGFLVLSELLITYVIPWGIVLLKKLIAVQLVKNSTPFMKLTSSLPCWHPVTGSNLSQINPVYATMSIILTIHSPNSIWWRVQLEAPQSVLSFPQPPFSSFLFGPNILLSILLSNTLNSCFAGNAWDRASHPCKTTGRVMVLYVSDVYALR